MATVYIETRKRDKRNSYIVYYKHPFSGKNKYYKTFQKKKEAQAEAHKLRALLDTGTLPDEYKTKIKPVLLTIPELADALIEIWEQKLSGNQISLTTFDGYLGRILRIKSEFKQKLVCEIRKREILDYRINIANTSSNVNSNRYLFIVKQIFKLATDMGIILEDPTKDIQYLSERGHERNKYLRGRGVYPKTSSLIFQVDLPCLNA